MGDAQNSGRHESGAEGLGRFWTDPEWNEEPVRPRSRPDPLLVVVLSIVGLVMLAGSAVFLFGEDLFGSDQGSIDTHNREVLDSCPVPPESTLVQTYVASVLDQSDKPLRTMSYVYASPLPAAEVAGFFGVNPIGAQSLVAPDRSCRFGNRPSVLVLAQWTAEQGTVLDPQVETTSALAGSGDEFWGPDAANVTSVADAPGPTQSFFRLRLTQSEVEGVLD